MKTVILAGGLGTRLAEETDLTPKPMVEIGGSPILWHIMKIYASHGFNEFVVALGYRAEVVKHYFLNYYHLRNDFTIEVAQGKVDVHDGGHEDWRVHLIDTGHRRRRPAAGSSGSSDLLRDETFMLTYGDGVADANIAELLAFHRCARQARHGHGRAAAGALRRARLRRRPRRRVRREAADRRGLDQRRLLRARARRARLHRRRRDDLGARAAGAARARTASSSRTATKASGSRWTRCATCACSRASGRAATCHGRCGSDAGRHGRVGACSSRARPAWSAPGWSRTCWRPGRASSRWSSTSTPSRSWCGAATCRRARW